MHAEAAVDHDEVLAVGLGELEEEDAGGKVVDVGDSVADEGAGELVRDDLAGVSLAGGGRQGRAYLEIEGGESLLHSEGGWVCVGCCV